MKRLTFVLATVATSHALRAQAPTQASAPPRNAASVEHLLRPQVLIAGQGDTAFDIVDRMRYWHVPGISLAIVDGFRIVYAKGFGVTEFGGTTAVDTSTLFLAGSISKPVFASGVLRLVEQGKLSLDEDVNAHLKSWRVPESRFTEKERVTLRRLLSHTAGLTIWGFPGYEANTPVPTVPQVLDGAPPANTGAVRNDTTPGARWLYSGGGFTIAQLLASDVSGESFPALMKRLVLMPAAMIHSTYENPLPAARSREAASGHERIDTPVPGRYHTYPEMAAAGLWTTASDLARWEIALARSYNGLTSGRNNGRDGGTTILSQDMARQMVSEQAHPAEQYGGGAYGLGVAVEGTGDSLAFSHGGRDEGFVAQVRMWPRLGRGYVILTNGVSGPMMNEVARAVAEVYGLGARPRPERRTVDLDATALAPIAGHYLLVQQSDTTVLDVTVEGQAAWLYTSFGKRRYRLWPESPDAFFDANTGNTFLVERDSTKATVTALRMGRAPNSPRAVRR